MTSREFPAAGLRGLDIELQRGSVTVLAREGPKVKIRVSPCPGFEDCEISCGVDSGLLNIKGRRPGLWFLKRWDSAARLTIEAPSRLALRAVVGLGVLRVHAREGPVRLTVLSGAARAQDLGGTLRARIGRGRASAAGVRGESDILTGAGRLRLHRLSGKARVILAAGAADLRWSTAPSSGGITAVCAAGTLGLSLPTRTSLALRTLHAWGSFSSDFPPPRADSAPLNASAILGVGDLAVTSC